MSAKPQQQHFIWFLHFHKAAGSSFIDLAWRNNEIVRHAQNDPTAASHDVHGHLELDSNQQFRWQSLVGNKQNCELFQPPKQAKLLQEELMDLHKKGITFVSTEHWFPSLAVIKQQQLHNKATLVTLMRHPMDRLASSFYFHKAGGGRCLNVTKRRRTCTFDEWWPSESNIHVKMLNGIPFGPLKFTKLCRDKLFTHADINETMYQQARDLLNQFDIVLTLESIINHKSRAECVLQTLLGWNDAVLPKKNARNAAVHNDKNNAARLVAGRRQQRRNRNFMNQRRKEPTSTIHEEALKRAEKSNHWDMQLYQYAQELEQELFERLGC